MIISTNRLLTLCIHALLCNSLAYSFQGANVALLQTHKRINFRTTESPQERAFLNKHELFCGPISTRLEATSLKIPDQTILVEDRSVSCDAVAYKSTEKMNGALRSLCDKGDITSAMKLLLSAEDGASAGISAPDVKSYMRVMKGLLAEGKGPEEIAALLERMSAFCKAPTAAYNVVISAWAASSSEEGPERADEILHSLWSMYNETSDATIMPNRATYMGVMTAYSKKENGAASAIRAEELLEEMEGVGAQHPTLKPTSAFANVVLSAWSRSRSPEAISRCTAILSRMEKLTLDGRDEISPSTVTFNTIIDAMARRNKPSEGEELLLRMSELSQKHFLWDCEPDSISFNTVLKGWARCKRRGSAKRAEDILKHMEQHYNNKTTDIAPDEASYSNVIHAWSKSREPDAASRSVKVFQRMEQAFEDGNSKARPGTVTYNTMINVLSKCGDESAPARALELMDEMKSKQIDRDVFTYTSAINVMAKAESAEWSDKAESLLDEMLEEQRLTGRSNLKPNVRTFTSLINAVARSKERPERALAMLEKMRAVDVEADSICYNAVINAYGWSNVVGKEEYAFQVLMDMLQPDSNVKPDIITANSVLHCCAFAVTDSEAHKEKVMECAIKTLEIFTCDTPLYGWPDHITFSNMLLTIAKQMPLNEKRVSLAEATFWQCCEGGHVSSLVLQRLRLAIPPERLASLLGSAIVKNTKSSFVFDMQELPVEWRTHAPRPGRRTASRASEKKEEGH